MSNYSNLDKVKRISKLADEITRLDHEIRVLESQDNSSSVKAISAFLNKSSKFAKSLVLAKKKTDLETSNESGGVDIDNLLDEKNKDREKKLDSLVGQRFEAKKAKINMRKAIIHQKIELKRLEYLEMVRNQTGIDQVCLGIVTFRSMEGVLRIKKAFKMTKIVRFFRFICCIKSN